MLIHCVEATDKHEGYVKETILAKLIVNCLNFILFYFICILLPYYCLEFWNACIFPTNILYMNKKGALVYCCL